MNGIYIFRIVWLMKMVFINKVTLYKYTLYNMLVEWVTV